MAFLEPLYSHTGRPALNQPQIVRSFVLFFLLLSMGLTPPSLTAWVARLKQDRVLAALIGCPLSSLPPLGSYFDFMDRLWAAPPTDLYGRKKLLPASWNRKKPQKPNGKGQKAAEARPQITQAISMRILSGKDIPFNFESRLQKFFYLVAVVPSLESGLITSQNLTVSGDGTAVHTHANPRGHRSKDATGSDGHIDSAPRHFSDPDASWGWDSYLDKFYYGYTLFQFSTYNSELHTDIPLLFRFTSAKRHDSVNALVAFHELEKHMPALSIKICALILPWTTCLLIRCSKTEKSVPLLTSTVSAGALKRFLTQSKSIRTALPFVRKDCDRFPMAMINQKAILCGGVLLEKSMPANAKIVVHPLNMDAS